MICFYIIPIIIILYSCLCAALITDYVDKESGYDGRINWGLVLILTIYSGVIFCLPDILIHI